jgi:hypothetical protein
MLSTPPATASSIAPELTAIAAKLMACRPEAQKRFSETAETLSGQPAARTALRATFAPCSPTCDTAPTITSSTSAGSNPLRICSALSTCPKSSCG